MNIRWVPIVGALAVLATACSADADSAEPLVAEVTEPVAADVTFGAIPADGFDSAPVIDVWAAPGVDNAPMLILLDGVPPSKDDTEAMAVALANRGFVVLNAEWQADLSLATGGNYHAACLVQFARATADRFHGDASQVTVVGYSAGGSLAAVLALNGDAIEGQCEHDPSISPVPDSIIGLAGGYEYLVIDSPEPGFGPQILAEDPDRWETMNPYEHLDGATAVKALLIHGLDDKTVSPGSTERFAAALETGGADVTTHFLPDTGHSLTTGEPLTEIVEQIDTWIPRDS